MNDCIHFDWCDNSGLEGCNYEDCTKYEEDLCSDYEQEVEEDWIDEDLLTAMTVLIGRTHEK